MLMLEDLLFLLIFFHKTRTWKKNLNKNTLSVSSCIYLHLVLHLGKQQQQKKP